MTTVVVQARMGSTRLPGKVLRPLGGRPVLGWVIRAAVEAAVGEVVVATTTSPADDEVASFADAEGARVVRGSEHDVLSRFLLATTGLRDDDVVVRLTGDCPLLDPSLIRLAVTTFERADVDYLSTALERTLPRGEDIEVTRVGELRRIDTVAAGPDREHVTSLLYREPARPVAGLVFHPPSDDLRLTLDTLADAELLDAVVASLGDRAPAWQDVVRLLRDRPELAQINAHVRQKTHDDG